MTRYDNGMSLTRDDLQAIKTIVDTSVTTAVDSLAIQTAAGFADVDKRFAEVHEKFTEVHGKLAEVNDKLDNLQDTVGRIERVQRAEVERVDQQSTAITNIRKALRTV